MLAIVLILSLLHYSASQGSSVSVVISVNGSPSSHYSATLYERINLICTAEGLTDVDQYQWLFANELSDDDNGYYLIHESNSPSLAIDSVNYLQHLGNYYCRVEHAGHTYTSAIFSFEARYAAIFPVDNVASVHVVAGDSVVLQCVVVLPPLETSYEIGWLNVSGGELVSEYSAGNDMFHISEALEGDAGEYRCILKTQTSGTEDADIELVVITPPQFFTIPTQTLLTVLEDGMLRCGLVPTDSAVNFTWHLNGQPLPQTERLQVSSDSITKMSTLTITDVSYAESGDYECIASNSAGSTRQLHGVTVQGPPVISPAPDSLELVVPFHQNMHIMDCPYIANPAATVRWLKEDQALISGRGKYIVHDNGTLLISDLTLEDGGSYRCVLANTMGVAEATYNLLVIGPPAAPEGLEVTMMDADSHGVLVTWSTPPRDPSRPIAGYLVQYVTEGETPVEVELVASRNEVEISLFPGETYQVTLHAFNTVGTSLPSISSITLPVSAPSMSFNVSAQPDGYSLLTQWQLNYDGGPSVSTFTIQVYAVGDIELLLYSVDANISDQSLMLAALEPLTQYTVEVVVSNGEAEQVMTFDVTTSAAPPGQPSTPLITLTTTHIFQLTFTVRPGSRPLINLLLNISTVVDHGENTIEQVLIDINDSLYVDALVDLPDGEKEVVLVIGGQQQLQQYAFQVAAITAIGQGEFSEPSAPQTLDDARVLYFIVFGVVGGALAIIIIVIVVAMATLRTTKQIQRTKRTLSINGGSSPREIPESFVLPSTPAERRRPSIQAVNPIMSDYGSQCDTPLSSVSNYKHHMLSSSTGETGTPIYDRLCDLQKDGDSESEGRNGSVSSDGADGQDSCSNGQVQAVQRVVVDMYSSEGKIDSVVHNFAAGNGASAQPSPPPPSRPSQLYPPHLHSSAGQLQVKSTHSLYQPIQLQVTRQKLPSSLHQLPLVQRGISPQHLLPPPTFSVGSSPAINCRYSRDSMLDGCKPTSYMTDV